MPWPHCLSSAAFTVPVPTSIPTLSLLFWLCLTQYVETGPCFGYQTGSDTPTVTKTALMDMYSKYGQLGSSVRVFEEVGFKDVVTWNTMLSSFVRHGRPEEALAVFREMQKEGVWGKQVHALVVVMGRDLVVLGTALIDFYTNVECIEEAMEIFHNLNWKKDDVMRNSLISGCVRNRRYKEAFLIMSAMRPNVVAVTSALTACSKNSDLWVGKQIHCVAMRFGFTFDTQLCNVLLDISQTVQEDGGRGNSILPNLVTFLAVLSACAHSGMVEQGQECRAGQIEEVWRLFNNMIKNQTKPTAAVWAAILNACSHNLDVSRGEFAAKNLLELEPNKPGNYVLLSNFYAAVGRWDSVNELRSIMRKKGLVKETGNSWVTVAHCHENIQHIN
ncbi:Pentatricopeptide repeat-containing protein, mitochondrial [Vitis vinifera]|uniref:Pentatricopeptide repeat-containing protein, mitochondrial n=1 Tax=Vitis vinifera TaxID=29760 RepID=A0A438DWE8_VITVI|nr:Pentatricopeptide repeat-containing protein, mitochondrial [Vitis vinifera]